MNWWPFKPKTVCPPDETTHDRRELIDMQKRKLASANRLASELRRHDRENHYSQRLRLAYVRSAPEEGTT